MINNLAAVVLAGGKGKRMESKLVKVLHKILGKPMIFYTLETLAKLNLFGIYVVVCYQEDKVIKAISAKNYPCEFIHLDKPLGTAYALKPVLKQIPENIKTLLVVGGDDSAFYTSDTLKKFIKSHFKTKAVVSALTVPKPENTTSGRVIRDKNGHFEQILELKEYLLSGLNSDELNCGCYLFNVEWLKQNLEKVTLSMTGEYYITDLLNIAKAQEDKINLFNLEDETEWVGINTKQELKIANQIMEKRLKY